MLAPVDHSCKYDHCLSPYASNRRVPQTAPSNKLSYCMLARQVKSLYQPVPAKDVFRQVVGILVFLVIILAILGVNFWGGVFFRRCRTTELPVWDANATCWSWPIHDDYPRLYQGCTSWVACIAWVAGVTGRKCLSCLEWFVKDWFDLDVSNLPCACDCTMHRQPTVIHLRKLLRP